MVEDYRAMREERGLGNISQKCLLILTNPSGSPSREDLVMALKESGRDFIKATPPTNAGSHLTQDGIVVEIEREELHFLLDNELVTCVDNAEDGNVLSQRIMESITEAGLT